MSSSMTRKALELFSTDQKLEGKKKKINQGALKQRSKPEKLFKSTFKDKQVKSAIEEFKKTQKGDQTAKNLALFKRLGGSKTPSATMSKALQRKHRKEIVLAEKPVKKETSCFTEEDFAWFENEYHLR